jgi:DNA-binding response OmpR family regulator
METLGARVLIVDGEDAVRALLADGLQQTGFSVLAVPNGRAMLDAIPDWCPEAIVLDVMLPDIDGFTLAATRPPVDRRADHHRERANRKRAGRDLEYYADITIDVGRRLAYRGRRAFELSTREFDLLLTFVRNPGVVFMRNALLDLVWGVDRDILPNTVETYISYLRAKIDRNDRAKLIHTLRGAGYVMRTSARLTGSG